MSDWQKNTIQNPFWKRHEKFIWEKLSGTLRKLRKCQCYQAKTGWQGIDEQFLPWAVHATVSSGIKEFKLYHWLSEFIFPFIRALTFHWLEERVSGCIHSFGPAALQAPTEASTKARARKLQLKRGWVKKGATSTRRLCDPSWTS